MSKPRCCVCVSIFAPTPLLIRLICNYARAHRNRNGVVGWEKNHNHKEAARTHVQPSTNMFSFWVSTKIIAFTKPPTTPKPPTLPLTTKNPVHESSKNFYTHASSTSEAQAIYLMDYTYTINYVFNPQPQNRHISRPARHTHTQKTHRQHFGQSKTNARFRWTAHTGYLEPNSHRDESLANGTSHRHTGRKRKPGIGGARGRVCVCVCMCTYFAI